MEKHWLTLARSFGLSERLTDFTTVNSEWRRNFDQQVRASERPDDAPRLQKIIQEGNVDALFERMWLASIVDSTDDAIISKNLDGIITSWNKSAQWLFGYPAEEVIGKSVTIIIPPERHHEEDMILGHIRRGERIVGRVHIAMPDVEAQIAQQGRWYGELTHITRDGREIIVESRLVRVNYEGDLYTLETNRDITARKHLKSRLTY